MHPQSLEQNNQLDATINRKIYCLVVQILLSMFRALQCPSSGARQTAVAASCLPSELGDSSAVGRGRADRHGLARTYKP